jgi:hypothetical protein
LNTDPKTRAEMIAWRRNKIIELKAQGLDQIEIARVLQVSPATITCDLQYMRDEAMQNIREYTTNELPLQYRTFKKALQNAIQTYWKLSQEAKDDRDKIDALEHYIDSHTTLWSLLLGGETYENNRQYKNKMALAYQQQ